MDDQTFVIFMPLLMSGLFFVFLFAIAGPRQGCPDCGRPLPRIQSPFRKSQRQWVEGGYLCPQCGCETDLAGRKVAPGTGGPRPSWIVRSVLLGLPPICVGVVLLCIGISLSSQEPEPPLAPVPPPEAQVPPVAPAPVQPGR
jgi:hypothetical protein